MSPPAFSNKAETGRVRRRPAITQRIGIFAVIASLIVGVAVARTAATATVEPASVTLSASLSAAETIAQEHERILFFEHRLARTPNDIDLLNHLSGFYLERLRESGAFSDLDLARSASHRSLGVVPPVRNAAGLTAQAMVEFASHDFAATRRDAQLLTRLDGTGTANALLGDAEAELGDYSAAAKAYARLQHSVGTTDENVATRRARMDVLRGDSSDAQAAFAQALALEAGRATPSRERIAWYSWQLGDTAFFAGDVARARGYYEDALRAYPGYFKALASLGRLDAVTGNTTAAITEYGEAIERLPDPTFVAELGDVYAVTGDRASAQREYELVETIGHLSTVNGVMYNRQLVLFDADHDRNAAEAFRLARQEYRGRRDILGADAVAWTALKAGDLTVAAAAMHDALRLGTRDPRLLYHAGMIARARGDVPAARTYLTDALRLNPGFDVLQAPIARAALAGLAPPEAGGSDR